MLGFTAGQERLYRMVLRTSGRSVPELAVLAGLRLSELREQLTRFAGSGLVDLGGDVVVARPPQEALVRLVNDEARRVLSRGERLIRSLSAALVSERFEVFDEHRLVRGTTRWSPRSP